MEKLLIDRRKVVLKMYILVENKIFAAS